MSLLDEEETDDLERLESLLVRWGVDFILVTDSYSLRALGYNIEKRRHINVVVDVSTLPWECREIKHEVLPPRGSVYFDEYIEFFKSKASLHLIPYSSDVFKRIRTIEYQLPNGRKIKTTTPVEGVRMWTEEMKQYKVHEIGEYKLREWLNKIRLWKEIAEKHKDGKFAETCERSIQDLKNYFNLE